MSYNWKKDRNEVFLAIKIVANDLIQNHDFKLIDKEKIHNQNNYRVVLFKKKLFIKFLVTRSSPYEIYFHYEDNKNEYENMVSLFFLYCENDIKKVDKFLEKHYNKEEQDFENKEDYYLNLLQRDFTFLENEYPNLLKDGLIPKKTI